ncbi:MAG: hypothetical protein QNL91_07050 [Candidatus Krumholzibacteria bacterium]|nr:hypothetical protein [Candidatus Krumholzibacteria bacterium]
MSHRFANIPRLLLGMLLCLAVWSATAAVAADNKQDRRAAVARINDLMRQDLRAEALPLCRQYTTDFPDDPVMWYNLACLENTAGDADRAVTAYAAALAAGFGEWDLAAGDPDLQGAVAGAIAKLTTEERQRITRLVADQSLSLELDTWSEPRNLIPHRTAVPTATVPLSQPQLRLIWNDAGLGVELTAGQDWEAMFAQAATRAPWNGGPGLILSLGVLDDLTATTSGNHHLFAFGIEAKGGVGGLYIPAQQHWQQVLELAPKIRIDEAGQLRLTTTIPWQALMPYNPVVDTPLGVNATLVMTGGQQMHRASLVETGDTLDPQARQRRFARLDFRTDSITGDLFLGKLSNSLSDDQPLDLELVAISAAAGPATLSLNFMDQAGRSVLPDGPIRGKIDLTAGTNRITRQADFSPLKTGGYIMQAELTFPSGARKNWAATVLQLPSGWQEQYEERISMVALPEQATVRYLLDKVAEAAAKHLPRRSPGALVTTLIDVDQMLADADEFGSILPKKGSFAFVYPGPDGQDRVCHLYLPAGRNVADGLNPIVVLNQGNGQESRLAARIGRNYEHGDQKPTLKTGQDDLFPVYLVPELGPDALRLPNQLMAEAEACRRWAQDYFLAPGTSLVGIDGLGGTALQMIGQQPASLHGVLIFAGQNLDPWPQAQPDFIRQKLSPAPTELPVTWLNFRHETRRAGQAPAILQAMKDLGYQISDEQEVRGGLNLTQVADRVVLWAEGLR